MSPLSKPDDMESTLPDEKAKGEIEADKRLSSKVLLKEKLKQSNSVDPVVPLSIPASVILKKKRWLDNLNILWNSCKTCKCRDLMSESWQKDVKSDWVIDFQKLLYIFVVYIYFCHVFGVCDKHLMLIARPI